jgi:hypothetical protein
VAMVLYTAFGFLLLPWILKRQLERRLTEALHRQVTIERVRTNPYALSVTIDGFAVKERDGAPFLGWDRLYVNLKLWRVIRRELDLEELQLVRFRARVALDPKGNLNFQDLLDESSSDSDSQKPPEKRPFVFAIDRLDIVQAQIDFSDRSRRRPFDTQIGPFDIKLEQFRSVPDSTSPYSFAGTTESGETFSWAGSVLTEPVRSTGTITFDGLQLKKYSPYYEQSVGFEIRDGKLGLRTGYQLEWGGEKRILKIVDGSVAVRTLVLGLPGAPTPKVELPAADIGGIGVDVPGRVARVESVALKEGIVRAHRSKDGAFDVEAMGPPKSSAPSKPTPKDEAWQWSLGRIELAGWKLEFQDEVPRKPVSLTLAPLDVRLEEVASKKSQTSQLAVSAVWNGAGKIEVAGPVQLLRPTVDLAVKVDGLDLRSIDPYIDLYGDLAARLADGRFRLNGKARFDGATDPASWAFEGDTGVERLILLDSERGQELARWRDLQVSGIQAASKPMAVSIRSIRWLEPKLRVSIAEDGSSNLRRLLKSPPPSKEANPGAAQGGETVATQDITGAATAQTPAAPAKQDAPARKSSEPQAAVSIGSFQIVRGVASFADRSVNPPVAVSMTDLDVRIRGLSNALNARSQVSIKGLVGGGPLEISGVLSPRMVNDATDVKVSSKGVDLTPLSPYCGKHAGYLLDKGTLDLDLQYKVAKRHLAATNLVKINQFTFGEATNSPDATKLPVKLGLAVLQDRDGLIELDVPVEGNVDDPNFRLSRLIWHAIGNVLIKAVTAPFTLLGKLFGGGGADKIDVVDFQAGTAALTPTAEKTLQGLSKALTSRPALRMDIEGTADPAADGKSLKLQELRRQAQLAKGKGSSKGKAPDKGAEITDEEYLKYVQALYRQNQPALPPGAGPTPAAPDPAAMEEAVLANIQLPPEALRALSQERADTVKSRLVALGIDAGRLFPAQGGEKAKKEGGARAYFTLK